MPREEEDRRAGTENIASVVGLGKAIELATKDLEAHMERISALRDKLIDGILEKAKALKPSPRGELEITDLNKVYMEEGNLKVSLLGRGMAWLDTGTHESMLKASNFVEAVQTTQGTFIACLEEIAYRQGWISKEKVRELAQPLMKTEYGKYLIDIIEEI